MQELFTSIAKTMFTAVGNQLGAPNHGDALATEPGAAVVLSLPEWTAFLGLGVCYPAPVLIPAEHRLEIATLYENTALELTGNEAFATKLGDAYRRGVPLILAAQGDTVFGRAVIAHELGHAASVGALPVWLDRAARGCWNNDIAKGVVKPFVLYEEARASVLALRKLAERETPQDTTRAAGFLGALLMTYVLG